MTNASDRIKTIELVREAHSGKADEILRNRNKVYEAAKALHPERWTGDTRNWILEDTVALNPTDEMKKQLKIAV